MDGTVFVWYDPTQGDHSSSCPTERIVRTLSSCLPSHICLLRRDLEYEVGQFEALREEEKQKYGYGEAVDYSTRNLIPTAVDALVRLVIGNLFNLQESIKYALQV